MEFVFPALDRRFRRDGQLKKLARRLYLGSTEQVRVPLDYVEVVAEDIAHDFDTFDTDEPVYTLTFTVYTKQKNVVRCSQIMRHLLRVFDDADLESGHFRTSGMRCLDQSGPDLIDGLYQGTVRFVLHVTLRTLVPVTRGST